MTDKIIDTIKKLKENLSDVEEYGLEKEICKFINTELKNHMTKWRKKILDTNILNGKMQTIVDNFFAYSDNNDFYCIKGDNNRKLFIKYNNNDYSIVNEDDIWRYIRNKIQLTDKTLIEHKYDITTKIMKEIKQNNLLLNTIPETETIQRLICFFYPMFFKTKEEVKYMFAVLGDNILKKNKKNIYYVSEQSREFFTQIKIYYENYFGKSEICSDIKFKYRGHNYDDSRIIRFRQSINNVAYWNTFIQDNLFNLIVVSCHYSTRYGSSEKYIEKQSQDIKDIALQLKGKEKKEIIYGFIKKMFDKYISPTSGQQLSMNDIYFLWKIYCDSINIPLIMNKKEFETLINYETVKYMVSPYLAPSRAFKIFWNCTIEYSISIDNEYEISELNELFISWLNKSSELNQINRYVIKEYQLKEIIRYFFPKAVITNNKIVKNINCNLWLKINDIKESLQLFKNNPPNKDIRLLDAYKAYCSYSVTNNKINIVSKKYFEKYIDKLIPDEYLQHNVISKEYWK
tara:strand:- start:799 stop:2343 length:1545 start_codon:yes stop_codon:yes gene_type:complete